MSKVDKEDSNGDILYGLDKLWQKHESSLFNTRPPEILYHYTSSSGIRGILTNNGIYASPYFSMNDPTELIYGLSVIEEACQDIINNSKASAVEISISKALLNQPAIVGKQYGPMFHTLILICFSEKRDNLSQWRCYADDGNGYSIGINTGNISFSNPQGKTGLIGRWQFYECIYDKSLQKQKVVNFISLFGTLLTNNNASLNPAVLGKYALAFLWDLASTFKHHAYCDEKEWRVRSVLDTNNPLDLKKLGTYTSGPHLKSSHLIGFMKHNVVSSVTIGPRNNFESSSLALKVLLQVESKINNPTQVQVIPSDAPYR